MNKKEVHRALRHTFIFFTAPREQRAGPDDPTHTATVKPFKIFANEIYKNVPGRGVFHRQGFFPWKSDCLHCKQGGHEVLQPDRKPSVHAFPKPPYQQADAAAYHVWNPQGNLPPSLWRRAGGMTCHTPHLNTSSQKSRAIPMRLPGFFLFLQGWIKKRRL